MTRRGLIALLEAASWPLGARARSGSIAIFTAVLLLLAGPVARTQPGPAADAEIRAALEQWTADFNARKTENICDLFAPELRYDYRGYPERSYDDICRLLRQSLHDPMKKYTYALDIKETLVSAQLAVVRLVWRLKTEALITCSVVYRSRASCRSALNPPGLIRVRVPLAATGTPAW